MLLKNVNKKKAIDDIYGLDLNVNIKYAGHFVCVCVMHVVDSCHWCCFCWMNLS